VADSAADSAVDSPVDPAAESSSGAGPPPCDPIDFFANLIDRIRPLDANDTAAARDNLHALCQLLNTQPKFARVMRRALIAVSSNHRHSEIYTATGILPNTGFFTEIFRRIGHKWLPEALEKDLLQSAVRQVFHDPDDARWVVGVGEDAWLHLIAALRFRDQKAAPEIPRPVIEMLRSLRVLSYWIAAAGMERELLRLDRALETYESPFVTQNEELLAYITAYQRGWRKSEVEVSDDKHLLVLLDQCIAVIDRVRKRAARDGTSVRLTYHLQHLRQLILRCEQLLDILDRLLHDPDGGTAMPAIVHLFTHLISEECQRDNLRLHWRRNTELIARRITD
ncbi:MAG: preprotein translocase subunit TatB, partial [Propionivibrio sp.]